MTTTAQPELTLEEPETVRAGGNAYRCGGITFRIIRHITRAANRCATVRGLAVAVWGKSVGPEVSRATIKMAVSRANDVLAGLGARERITLDGGAVLMV